MPTDSKQRACSKLLQSRASVVAPVDCSRLRSKNTGKTSKRMGSNLRVLRRRRLIGRTLSSVFCSSHMLESISARRSRVTGWIVPARASLSSRLCLHRSMKLKGRANHSHSSNISSFLTALSWRISRACLSSTSACRHWKSPTRTGQQGRRSRSGSLWCQMQTYRRHFIRLG